MNRHGIAPIVVSYDPPGWTVVLPKMDTTKAGHRTTIASSAPPSQRTSTPHMSNSIAPSRIEVCQGCCLPSLVVHTSPHEPGSRNADCHHAAVGLRPPSWRHLLCRATPKRYASPSLPPTRTGLTFGVFRITRSLRSSSPTAV